MGNVSCFYLNSIYSQFSKCVKATPKPLFIWLPFKTTDTQCGVDSLNQPTISHSKIGLWVLGSWKAQLQETRFGGLTEGLFQKKQRTQWHTVNKRCPSNKSHEMPSLGNKLKKSTKYPKSQKQYKVQQTVSCGKQGSIITGASSC